MANLATTNAPDAMSGIRRWRDRKHRVGKRPYADYAGELPFKKADHLLAYSSV